MLLDRVGLAREHRLIDEQVALGEQPAIARHDVSRFQLHHVTRHQLVDRDLVGLAIAERLRLKTNGAAERVDSVLGAGLLDDIEHHAQ